MRHKNAISVYRKTIPGMFLLAGIASNTFANEQGKEPTPEEIRLQNQ